MTHGRETTTMSETTNGTNGATHDDAGKIEHFKADLPCTLTDAEIAERAQRCERLRAEIEGVKARAKSEVAEIDSEVKTLALQVARGIADKPVACVRKYIYRIGRVQEVRTDTGAVLNDRAMTIFERQTTNGLEEVDETEEPSGETEGPDGETSEARSETPEPEPELPTEKRGGRGGGRKGKNGKASSKAVE